MSAQYYDLIFKKRIILSATNKSLIDYLRDCKRELVRTVYHRRPGIKGWQKVNLDTLREEGQINEAERRAGSRALDRIYYLLSEL